MRFSPQFLDDIRDRVPISDVVGRRVTWDRRKTQSSKGDFWACCPFHSEKSPSFHCEDRKGRYHCFGCGVSGDHFRFLVEAEGLSFPEAVERLAGEAGLQMPARDPEAEKRDGQRATILDALKLASGFFQGMLQEPEGAKARAYLRDRGIHPQTQKLFGIGYAPESRNRLKEFLAAKGVGKAEIEAAGLVVHGEGIAVSYDRFRDRIMFPIEDAQERVIAFGGRALSSDVSAKYLNSPETDVFVKGATLFNIARARRASKAAGTLVVVEGYVDVIALAQAGFENAVAPLGTALTDRQLELLWRNAPEPILCFDGDPAGLKAAHRAAEVALPALKPGRSLRFALLDGGQDPDDLVRERGADGFRAVLGSARPLADLLWMRETAGGAFDTPERRADLEHRLKGLTRQIGDESVRRHYLQDVDERLRAFFGSPGRDRSGKRGAGGRRPEGGGGREFRGRDEPRLGSASKRVVASDRLTRSRLLKPVAATTPALRETTIVVGFINHPVLFDEAFDYFADLDIQPGDLAKLRSAVLDVVSASAVNDREVLLKALADRGMRDMFEAFETQVRLRGDWSFLSGAAPEDARESLRQALHLHHRSRSLNRELRTAEEALGVQPSEQAFAHVVEVKRELQDPNGTEALIDGFGILSGRATKGY
ncbi:MULTISPECIES: DNA primase [unclassified Aureimonas]|uniref:DNA primase n=1 Tax=unclassified Aureimonas TaxID=2615206 RepID=UPI0006F24E9A|nr:MULTISPECIES: DNA primase [unclassified Aureimonas]KQT69605.1 DNA primase [Aureimonas sp. Leaf427]KQT80956.1 DNA primase [Aureimonas sp. Leaf460]